MKWKVPKQWKSFVRSNIELVEDILEVLEDKDYYPSADNIFEIFELLSPDDIRTVIVGQNPYPNNHACGIPFISKLGTVTKSLENIGKELMYEYPYLELKDINLHIRSWIKQGVFLINLAFTVGTGDEYTSDHTILWEEFTRSLIEYITKDKNIPVILMGSIAWRIDTKISIKVPHPVSRDDKFIGCNVFNKCNNYLDKPILWLSSDL